MKSLFLSAALTVVAFLYITRSFTAKQDSFYKTMPYWVVALPIGLILTGYLLALYWGFTGIIHGQRALNFLGIALSVLGIGCYWLGYRMQAGSGQETPGQFDHEMTSIEPKQRAVLYQLMQQTATNPLELVLVPYWKLEKEQGDFVACVQKGKIIGLQLKNKPVDPKLLNGLQSLNWLVLQECGLKTLSGLRLPVLQRLNVDHNQLTTLSGIEGLPQLAWFSYQDNPVADSTALKTMATKIIINY